MKGGVVMCNLVENGLGIVAGMVVDHNDLLDDILSLTNAASQSAFERLSCIEARDENGDPHGFLRSKTESHMAERDLSCVMRMMLIPSSACF